MQPLDRDFYLPGAEIVAPQLLGHFLLRRIEDQWLGGEIVETEAYLTDDPACHAYRRETPRNRAMWGEPGHAYVFKIYGGYRCVNAVCRPKGFAEAVLIRAIEPTIGLEQMQALRPVTRDTDLTNGPSKLCIAQNIGFDLNTADLTDENSGLIIAANPNRAQFLDARAPIIQTTRIGLTFAADWPLRWILAGSKSVSRRGVEATWPDGVAPRLIEAIEGEGA
ncbi:putative 3-methyladenine DNA glycosylase [Abditibacteriota bacterium]|nr:putative 3-methyladenine DNA glycosylase [Abditibacteriota bacterium]